MLPAQGKCKNRPVASCLIACSSDYCIFYRESNPIFHPFKMAAAPPPEAFTLPSPPNDGITALSYLSTASSSDNDGTSSSSSPSLLACTSWDGALRIYDVGNCKTTSKLVVQRALNVGPLLSLTIPSNSSGKGGGGGGGDSSLIFVGGANGSIVSMNMESSSVEIVGSHTATSNSSTISSGQSSPSPAVSCLAHIGNSHLIVSAGWDKQIYIWDTRVGSCTKGGGAKPVASSVLPGKAYSMDISADYNTIVVSTSGRRNCFFDIRKMMSSSSSSNIVVDPAAVDNDNYGNDNYDGNDTIPLLMDRESSLKYQTRCIKFFGDVTPPTTTTNTITYGGIAVGSIEGRVAIEYMDDMGIYYCPTTPAPKKYAFKCHRVNDTVYPVNAIAVHPKYNNTIATGGADGTVVTWDAAKKKKISNIMKCSTSIAALTYNATGTQMAIASSYTFEEGERDHPREEIYIRNVLDSEVKPKSKK